MFINIFEYDQLTNRFNATNLNLILSANGGGKTKLCQLLKNGFEGKMGDKFIINGELVNKTEYEVFLINDYDCLDNEKSFSAKSQYKTLLKNQLTDIEDERLSIINKNIIELKESISKYILNDIKFEKINVNLDISINDLVSKFSNIYLDEELLENVSFSKKRIEYIKLIATIASLSPKDAIVIIDEIDLGLSEYNTDKLIDWLKEFSDNNNVKIFVSTSNSNIDVENKIYVKDMYLSNSLYSLDDVKGIIAEKESCTLEDINEYFSLKEVEELCLKYNIDKLFQNEFLR